MPGSGGRENRQLKSLTRRAALLGAGQAMLLGVLAGRIYYLQVVEAGKYSVLAEENRISLRLIPPRRGRILDRFGQELASSRQNYGVVIVPERAGNFERSLAQLAKLAPIAPHQQARILDEARKRRGFIPVIVSEALSWEEFARINVNSHNLPGVQPVVGETRAYPFGPLLSHLLGYVAAVSEADIAQSPVADPLLRFPGFRVGRSGVEKIQDTALRGRAGNMQVEVNAYDRVIRELSRQQGVAGRDVVMTLDVELQKAAAAALAGQSGSIVLLDTVRGEVLALVSVPGFDPDAFNVGLTTAQWTALQNDPMKTLVNKSIGGLYPPGSTIKPMVALAALSSGAMGPHDPVVCTGSIALGGHVFHCWRKQGHGVMTMREAIKHSCDVYFYECGRRTGIAPMSDMARRFGLGEKHNLGLPEEKAGLAPSPEWKRARFNQPWTGGETLIAAIGQGYWQTTPLQLAVATARLASGGKTVTPRLFRNPAGEWPEPDELGIDARHLDLVHDGMWAVVNEAGGTAYGKRMQGNGYAYSGKTGTAQVMRISLEERANGVRKNQDKPWIERDHALFIGYAPSDKPRYAISVVIEHGGGGSAVAAPIARDILALALAREELGLKPYKLPEANA